jgi:hypothetical protein
VSFASESEARPEEFLALQPSILDLIWILNFIVNQLSSASGWINQETNEA